MKSSWAEKTLSHTRYEDRKTQREGEMSVKELQAWHIPCCPSTPPAHFQTDDNCLADVLPCWEWLRVEDIMWHDRPALAMPEVIFPDVVIRQIPHSLVSCKIKVQQLLGSVLQIMAGKLKLPLLFPLQEEREQGSKGRHCVFWFCFCHGLLDSYHSLNLPVFTLIPCTQRVLLIFTDLSASSHGPQRNTRTCSICTTCCGSWERNRSCWSNKSGTLKQR